MTTSELHTNTKLKQDIIAYVRQSGKEAHGHNGNWGTVWQAFQIPYAVYYQYWKTHPEFKRRIERAKFEYKYREEIAEVEELFRGATLPLEPTTEHWARHRATLTHQELQQRYDYARGQARGSVVPCAWCNEPFQKRFLPEVFCCVNCRSAFHQEIKR